MYLQGKEIPVVKTFSYKRVYLTCIKFVFFAIIISLLIYFVTQSAEVTLSLFALMIACIFYSFVMNVLWEYQTKRRGGTKTDQ